MFTLKVSNLGRMGGALFIVLAVAVGYMSLASVPQSGAQQAKDPKADVEIANFLKARAALAEKAYKVGAEAFGTNGRAGGLTILFVKPADVYTWSVRWLQAERDLNSKRAEQIAALEGHLKRMKELEQKAEALAGVIMPKMEVWEAEWYRMEAELWLAQAKAKK